MLWKEPVPDGDMMKLQILMSVYNGSLYLKRQLESIAAQDIPDKSLFIRDDGSADDSVQVLEHFRKQYPWISCHYGRNIGVRKSFFSLIRESDRAADYTAFSDQDDEWLPKKLSQAVSCLERLERNVGKDMPLLYCSAQQMAGKDLEPIPATVKRIVHTPDFGNALVQNICTGCTAVANRALMEILREHPPNQVEHIIMHDWWLYLTASCFGKVYYDKEPYILYRQHGENAFGAILNRRALLKYRLEQLRKPRGEIYRQTEEFLTVYGAEMESMGKQRELSQIRKLLSSEKNMCNRFRVACDRQYFRQKRMDDLVFRGIVLIGKL